MKPDFRSAQFRTLKKLGLGLSYCLSLASVLAISAEAIATPLTVDELAQAQTAHTETAQAQTAQAATPDAETIATDSNELRLQPSYSINFTEGAGHEGFASFGGFFPIFQTPGENVTFLEGRVSVDTDGDFGGGLQAGYRTLLNDSTILGAYAGLDARDTGSGTFTQAGIGAELLGENWDLTLNANLPLGNTRQVVDSVSEAVNPQFTGNQLLVDELQTNQVEAALTTVSLDGGLALFDFGGGSSLWGRGGVYFLGGEASDDSLGFRAALDYRATNNLRFGLGVQNDGVFGTNAIFSVNASLGSSSRRSYNEEGNSAEENSPAQLWARAAEPIARTNTVLIEERTDVEIVQDVTAINPETDQAFVFQHVDPTTGANGAVGTFEAPLATIAEATNIAEANADNIIFVQEGNAGGDFTLPEGVQARSVGPTQRLDTQFGLVTLPGSGSGNLPTVNGTATLGNNTLISGLDIDAAGADGIVASGSDIAIEDNSIVNASQGIDLFDVDGTITIARNQLSQIDNEGIFFADIEGNENVTITIVDNTLDEIGDEGIEVESIEGDSTANITISRNQISNVDEGIYIEIIDDNADVTFTVTDNQISDVDDQAIQLDEIIGNAIANITIAGNTIDTAESGTYIDFIEDDANATITIADNQISNTADAGIYFFDVEDNATANITIQNNTITDAGEEGIQFESIEDNATANITIQNNTISNAGDEGIYFFEIYDDTIANITISGNTISNTGDAGIYFGEIYDDAIADITISSNTISNTDDEGIYFGEISDDVIANITISGNTISNTGDEGIYFDDIEDNATANITIQNNTITDAGDNGIEFNLIDDDTAVNATIANNTIANPDANGVEIEHQGDTNFCLDLNNNTVTTPTDDGFELLSTGAGQFQIIDLANVTTANVGTFNPADIATNAAFANGTAGVDPCPE